jgi:two-component system response regulator NreC
MSDATRRTSPRSEFALSGGRRIRVVLVDDHQTLLEGLNLILGMQPDIEVVGEAHDGRHGVAAVADLAPDVALIDLSMPDGGGLQAIGEISASATNVKVLVLTRHVDAGFMDEAFRRGADGYVLKQSTSWVLLEGIRRVAAGERYVDPALSTPHRSRPPDAERSKAALSEREKQVLILAARGYANKEIAATLGLSVKTVEAHKTNGTQRLGISGRAQLVNYAVTSGWLQDV